jgi:hypothetical protein
MMQALLIIFLFFLCGSDIFALAIDFSFFIESAAKIIIQFKPINKHLISLVQILYKIL